MSICDGTDAEAMRKVAKWLLDWNINLRWPWRWVTGFGARAAWRAMHREAKRIENETA